jgi:hypothetical protein
MGDACDSDKDGDYLPNLSEPAGACTVGDTDPTLNADCDGDLMGDLAEYVHSTFCVTTGTFTCPGGPDCLHPINANFDGNPLPDWQVHSDGATSDYLFNYGEALLYLEDARIGIVGPNPCVADNGASGTPDLLGDADLDGYKNGVERYLTTLPGTKCAANTTANNEDPDAQPTDNNDDKQTNSSDLVRFGNAYNSNNPTHERFSRRHDLNGDGRVNSSDMVIFGNTYNTTCS